VSEPARARYPRRPALLIDQFLPEYGFAERHEIEVRAPGEAVFAAIRRADLGAALPVRFLLGLRALPGALLGFPRGLRELGSHLTASLRLGDFEKQGFTILAEAPAHELVLGLEGRFWTARGCLRRVDARTFRLPQAPGTARAVWNFVVHEVSPGLTRLSTETRVRCADLMSHRRFGAYWLLIRPWSGLIRRYMLRAIRREAERAA
jgi:hypothetical protein